MPMKRVNRNLSPLSANTGKLRFVLYGGRVRFMSFFHTMIDATVPSVVVSGNSGG
jgi:hypothetical protein